MIQNNFPSSCKLPFPNKRGEVIVVVSGFYLAILFYYTRQTPWQTGGLCLLTVTSLYWFYSLAYVNPASLGDFHITRKRAWLYVLVGFILILPGWFADSLYSYVSGEGWWEFGLAESPPLILSIFAVAVSEEFFFRGYLLGRLKDLNSRRWRRILLVNATFIFYKILVHVWEGWPFLNYVELFVVGMVEMLFETFWVDWTGSIVAPIVIHIGWDLIVFHNLSTLPYWAM